MQENSGDSSPDGLLEMFRDEFQSATLLRNWLVSQLPHCVCSCGIKSSSHSTGKTSKLKFGFQMALYPLSLIMVSAGIQARLLRTLIETGTTESLMPEMMKFADVGALVGTAEAAQFEAELLKGA